MICIDAFEVIGSGLRIKNVCLTCQHRQKNTPGDLVYLEQMKPTTQQRKFNTRLKDNYKA